MKKAVLKSLRLAAEQVSPDGSNVNTYRKIKKFFKNPENRKHLPNMSEIKKELDHGK